jgi:hypothetical protein
LNVVAVVVRRGLTMLADAQREEMVRLLRLLRAAKVDV